MGEKDRLRYRHELKYIINEAEKEVLMSRLKLIMKLDAHAGENGYFIRSLYFDDKKMTAYDEKLAGVSERKKYRIRGYNYTDNNLKLECKRKNGQYINKIAAKLSPEEYEKIINKDYSFLKDRKEKVCQDFYLECTLNGMEPVVFVDYDRVPFVYDFGEVRVTFDSHVRSGYFDTDICSKEIPVFEVLEPGLLIMEVKYTEYCPSIIKDIVQPAQGIYTAFSKYTMCLEKKFELQNFVKNRYDI